MAHYPPPAMGGGGWGWGWGIEVLKSYSSSQGHLILLCLAIYQIPITAPLGTRDMLGI